jgi:O-antigen biosynthesis protein
MSTQLPGQEVEVFVVDNNSVDDSNEVVLRKFPQAILIANQENLGFSKANNQAMRLAKGEYILLLNPDTVVQESTFEKVMKFMDAHPDAGGLGVHMVDGNGQFLPESKRGLPTPAVSFYKIFGISRIFKKSARFNKYHLGHLSKNATHEVDILSGAFMLMRKSLLDKIGLLDEAFFMYGEDIDLSWRIIQAGYKNYYFHDTTIIHYKGESTKKGSLNYVYVFYNAMVIFAQKHFSQKNARVFSWCINLAIWLRALVAVAVRFVKGLALPLWDIVVLFGCWELARFAYASSRDKIYQDTLVVPLMLFFCLIWTVALFFGGGYDKPYRPMKTVRPVVMGAALIFIFYSLLPENMRFSRALIVIGTVIALAVFALHRMLLRRWLAKGGELSEITGIMGHADEVNRVQKMFIGEATEGTVVTIAPACSLERLRDYITIHKLGRLVFCARDVSSSQIIGFMTAVSDLQIEMKIAPPESLFMIGSNSIEKSGDIAILDVNSITLPQNKRIKLLVDTILSMVSLIVWPLCFWMVKNPVGWLKNSCSVLLGRRTWVGPDVRLIESDKLAKMYIKPAVIHPSMGMGLEKLSQEALVKINTLYIKDYNPWRDLRLMWKCRAFWGQVNS